MGARVVVRRNCLFGAERGCGDGAYAWPSIADVQKWHGGALKEMFGSEPTFTHYDTAILVDNEAHGVRKAA